MLPFLVGALGSLYSLGQAYDSMRFWSDYRKNTGRSPRYPFKSRSMDSLKYGAASGYAFSKLKRL